MKLLYSLVTFQLVIVQPNSNQPDHISNPSDFLEIADIDFTSDWMQKVFQDHLKEQYKRVAEIPSQLDTAIERAVNATLKRNL